MDVSYRIKKEKNGLSENEVQQLRNLNLDGEHQSVIFARDIFLFAVLTKGMAGRDLFYLTKDNIKDGVLTYTSKVNGREKTVRMKDSMQEIVDRYAQAGTPYLFPILTSGEPQGAMAAT